MRTKNHAYYSRSRVRPENKNKKASPKQLMSLKQRCGGEDVFKELGLTMQEASDMIAALKEGEWNKATALFEQHFNEDTASMLIEKAKQNHGRKIQKEMQKDNEEDDMKEEKTEEIPGQD